jgi:glycosyltransferase involved in cell wall biosynthesis
MVKHSKVTALVPAYQSADFIQSTLDSLSAQTHDNFDVIISVDLCDDDTDAICQMQCGLDSRFAVFKQEERLGYVGNCNFLLDQADADYVLFAFHDDLLAPDYLEKLCDLLDSRPEVIMTYSDVLLTRTNGNTELWIYKEMDGLHDRTQRGLRMLWQVGCWWVPNRGIFRLDEARRINGLKTHAAGEFSADLPWLFHMSLLGDFARVPETLCFKFYKPDSLSRGWQRSKSQYYALYVACMRELWSSGVSVREKIRMTLPFLPRLTRLRAESLLERIGK